MFTIENIGIELIFKQGAKKGIGPCIAIEWAPKSADRNEFFLLIGFGSGKVISCISSNGSIYTISKVSIGSSVRNDSHIESIKASKFSSLRFSLYSLVFHTFLR